MDRFVFKDKIMSEASLASQLASSMKMHTVQQARDARKAVRPQNAGRVQLSSQRSNGAEASMQIDATGQVVPSAKGVRKNSATASFASLLG